MVKQLSLAIVLGLAAASAAAQTPAARNMRFAAMDANRDGVITRQEWRGNAQAFAAHDWNNDGILSGEEVRPGGRRDASTPAPGGFGSAARDYPFTDWTASGFASLDHNRDGRITRDEWHFAAEDFRRADHDGDGAVTRAEFTGNDLPGASRGGRFDGQDTNDDGRITRAEWRGTAERFALLDTNRDGAITRQELRGGGAPQSDAWRRGRDRGLIEGRQAGREDTKNGVGWDLEGQRELETADSGYDAAFGPRADYQAGYRDGFREGYREGFNRR
jgi:hypothetical protein